MATKNLMEEFKSIEEIDKPSNNAQLDGIPVTVTKMQDPKRGKKRYFHAKISDGSKKMRLVGFNEDHQKQLTSYETQKSPIRIKECYIQRSSYSGDLEIKLNDTSVIEKSPTKFKIPSPPPTDFTAVSTISNLCSSDRVDVKIKVLKTTEPVEVSTGKQKQDIVIADKSAAIKLTLWEADIGMLEETQSYKLRQMMVRTFNDVKLLSYLRKVEVSMQYPILETLPHMTIPFSLPEQKISTISQSLAYLTSTSTTRASSVHLRLR